MLKSPVAVMAYTILEQCRTDLEGTLARVRALGYQGIETYGIVELFGAERVRRAIDAAGLELTSAHMPFPAGDRAPALLDTAQELGATTLVWSMEKDEFASRSSIRRGVERVNEAAHNAAERGMRIAYHNHEAEFPPLSQNTSGYELLLNDLDDSVGLELDLFWAAAGGADLKGLIDANRTRISHVHLRDANSADVAPDYFLPVGSGTFIDWEAVLGALHDRAWRIVELERLNVDVFDALESSLQFLRAQDATRVELGGGR